MKKIWLLISLLSCGLLLTGCNNLRQWNDFYSLCEESAKNLNCGSIFKWDWLVHSWDETILYWMMYSINKPWEFTSDESVECHFDNKWNLKAVHTNWRVFTPNNIANSNIMKTWWYLYRNLDLINEEDKLEYEALQNDRNMILKYQTDTSAAVNKFIDVIYDDLLKSCEQYWTGYETMKWTMYERNVCVDNYISDLYEKLKAELNNPRTVYLWDDPVLLSYYNDLNWDHPFVRYFVDLYDILKNQSYSIAWMMPKRPNWPILSEDSEAENVADWEALEEIFLKNGTWFYTYSEWNIWESEFDGAFISGFWSWIVINWNLLERIQNEYWYNFSLGADDILYWTAPDRWGVVIHYNDWYNDYIYQIYREWAGSWELYLLVWLLKDWLRVPIWDCWYLLYPRYPVLFWECKEWQNFDSLTVLTRGDNLYQYNNVQWMADNFRYSLRYLESIRVLNK